MSVSGGIIIVFIAATDTENVHPAPTLKGGKEIITSLFPKNSSPAPIRLFTTRPSAPQPSMKLNIEFTKLPSGKVYFTVTT